MCKKMEFYFQSNSVLNSLKCPKSKSLSHCPAELVQIYQNKHWTIRRWDDCSVGPSSHRIILKIVGFLIINLKSVGFFSNTRLFIRFWLQIKWAWGEPIHTNKAKCWNLVYQSFIDKIHVLKLWNHHFNLSTMWVT
jgi:hypothetical protein